MDDDRRLTDFHVTDRGKSDAAGPLRVTAENSSGIPMATPYKRILPKLWSDNFYLTKKPRTTLEVEQKGMFNYETRVSSRIVYTKWQLDEMEKVFSQQPYPDTNYLNRLSTKLDIPLKKLRNWFQNRRTKLKKRDLLRNYPVRNCDLSLWTPRRRASASIPKSNISAASAPIKNNVLLVYSDMYTKPRMVTRVNGPSADVQKHQGNINLTSNVQNFPPNAGNVQNFPPNVGLVYNQHQPMNMAAQYSNPGYFPMYFANYGLPLIHQNVQLNNLHQNVQLNAQGHVDRAPINNPVLSQYYNSLTRARLGAYYMQLQNQVESNQKSYHTLINVNLESKNPRNIGPYTANFNVSRASNTGFNNPNIVGPWTKQGMSNSSIPCYNPRMLGPSAMPRNPIAVPLCGKINLNRRLETLPGPNTSFMSSAASVASNSSERTLENSSINKKVMIGTLESNADSEQKIGGYMWQPGRSPCSKRTTIESSNENIPLIRQPYPISLCRAPFIGHTNFSSVNKFLSQATMDSANQDEILHTGSYSPQTNYHSPVWAYVSTPTKMATKDVSETQTAEKVDFSLSPDFKKNPVICDTSEQLSDDDGFSSIPSEKSSARSDSSDSSTSSDSSSDSSSDEQSSPKCCSFESNRRLCLDSSYDGFEFLDVNQQSFDNSYSSKTGCSNVYNDSGIGMENVCPTNKPTSNFNPDFSPQARTHGSKYPYSDYVGQEKVLSGVRHLGSHSCERMPTMDYRTYGHFARTVSSHPWSYQENDARSWNVSSSETPQETLNNDINSSDSIEKFKNEENKMMEKFYNECEAVSESMQQVEHQDSSNDDESPTVERGLSADIEQPDSTTQVKDCIVKRGISEVNQPMMHNNYSIIPNEDDAIVFSGEEDKNFGICSSASTFNTSEKACEDGIKTGYSDEVFGEKDEKKLKDVSEEFMKQGRISEINDKDYVLKNSCHGNMEDQSRGKTANSKATQSLPGPYNMSDWSCASHNVSNSSAVSAGSSVTSKLPSISSLCSMDFQRTCVANNQDFDRNAYVASFSGQDYNLFRSCIPGYNCPESHSHDSSHQHGYSGPESHSHDSSHQHG